MMKYRAIPEVVDGVRFHSKKEAQRYRELKLLESAGRIKDLTLQPAFSIIIEGQKICRYFADFRYWENGVHVVEDVKGYETREFKLKWKLVKALFGNRYDFRITQ